VSARDGGRFLASRGLTAAFYLLAVLDINDWDRADDWKVTAVRLASCVAILWLAVARTAQHAHEERQKAEKHSDDRSGK